MNLVLVRITSVSWHSSTHSDKGGVYGFLSGMILSSKSSHLNVAFDISSAISLSHPEQLKLQYQTVAMCDLPQI